MTLFVVTVSVLCLYASHRARRAAREAAEIRRTVTMILSEIATTNTRRGSTGTDGGSSVVAASVDVLDVSSL